jgi:hypothetical protein
VRQAAYEETVGPLLAELAASGVSIAMMKGAAMLSRYPSDTRLLNDVDVLIRRSDQGRVAAVFEASGFQNTFSDDREVMFVKSSGRTALAVDVHWSLHGSDVPFSIDPDALMSRAEPAQFGSAAVLALSREDTLLNYAAQLITDSLTVNFQRLADLHVLATSGLDWTAFCDTAIDAGAAGAGYLVVAASGLLGAEVPEVVPRTLERRCAGCRIATSVVVDPRWPLERFRMGGAVTNVLVPLLCPSTRYRVERLLSTPATSFGFAKKNGRGPLQALATAVRATALTSFSAVAIGLLYVARAGWLIDRVRALLWRRAEARL